MRTRPAACLSLPSRPSRPSLRSLRSLAVIPAFALCAAGAADPARACRPGDANTFCADLDSPEVLNSPEPDGRFGAALAFGDFNGDGTLDLAVGAPGQSSGKGRVFVFYTSGKALVAQDMQVILNSVTGPDTDAAFGSALAAADFDLDGFDDLAVGAPFQDLQDLFGHCVGGTCSDAGVVHYIRGGAAGLLESTGVVLEPPDRTFNMHYGAALAAGKVTNSGAPVLAIGIPDSPGDGLFGRPGRVQVRQANGPSVPQVVATLQVGYPGGEAGGDEQGAALVVGRFAQLPDRQLVYAAPGSAVAGTNGAGRLEVANYNGTSFEAIESFVQTDFGSAGNSTGSRFGSALAVGDFDHDGLLDLAVGAADRDLTGGLNRAGRVYVAFGFATGLTTTRFQIFQEDSFPGQTGADQERFGAALAGGDFDGDTFDDLAIGAPGEGGTDTGFVFLAWGTNTGLDVDAAKGINFSQSFVQGTNGADDNFGSVLAAKDLEDLPAADGPDELAIGVPAKDVGADADAGMVYVTRRLDRNWVFADGFESNGTAVWSTTVP